MRWLCVAMVVFGCGLHPAAEDWETRDYVAAGVPDPGHAWSGAELGKAIDAIAQAATDHPHRLPRFHGARSGAVFARVIEQPRDDASAPVTPRIGAHLERFEALNKLNKQYMKGLLGAPPREQIELFGALLHEAVAISALSAAFLATFPPDDPSLPNRQHGLATFYDGVAGMLQGSVMIADDKRVADADRLAVFGYLADTAPALLPRIPAERQQAIRTYVDKLVAATDGELHDAAARVQRAIANQP